MTPTSRTNSSISVFTWAQGTRWSLSEQDLQGLNTKQSLKTKDQDLLTSTRWSQWRINWFTVKGWLSYKLFRCTRHRPSTFQMPYSIRPLTGSWTLLDWDRREGHGNKKTVASKRVQATPTQSMRQQLARVITEVVTWTTLSSHRRSIASTHRTTLSTSRKAVNNQQT